MYDGLEMREAMGFLVTKDGRVFKPPVTIEQGNQSKRWKKELPLREVNPSIDSSGYFQVRQKVGARSYYVSRLVAQAWIPNPEHKPQVNHIDGDTINNDASNLEWATPSENVRHAYTTGLRQIRKGSKSFNSKYSEVEVTKIYLDCLFSCLSQEEIGRNNKVPQITVSNIRTKKTWGWLTDVIDYTIDRCDNEF